MKQYLTKGALALVLGGFLTSCSHEEFDISTYVADKVKAYEQVFVSEFGSIDPNQDWGFGSTTSNSGQARRMTRAASTWSNYHVTDDAWKSDLNFEKPADAITVTDGMKFESNKNYYIKITYVLLIWRSK